jgi:hypothetical protein
MRWKKDPVQQDSQARQEPFIIAHPDGMRSRSPVPIIEWAGQKGLEARRPETQEVRKCGRAEERSDIILSYLSALPDF